MACSGIQSPSVSSDSFYWMMFDVESLGSSCHSRNTEHALGALRVLGPVLPSRQQSALLRALTASAHVLGRSVLLADGRATRWAQVLL